MSQDCQATDIQWSYIEHDKMGFSQGKTDWHFYSGGNDGVCSSIEKPEQGWQNH